MLLLIVDLCLFRYIEGCFPVHVCVDVSFSLQSDCMSFLSSPQVMNREAMHLFQLC